MVKWNRHKIISKIKELPEHSDAYVRKNNNALRAAAKKEFGSWGAAVGASGIDYSSVKKTKSWNKNSVLHEVNLLQNKTEKWVRENDVPLYKAAIRYFTSWMGAIEACGVDYSTIRINKAWSEDLLVNGVSEMIEKDIPISSKVDLYMAIIRRYGSLTDFCDKFCLPSGQLKWDKDKVVKEIRILYEQHQSLSGIQNIDLKLYVAARQHHGSWKNAVNASGFQYEENRSWNKDVIVQKIKLIDNKQSEHVKKYHSRLYHSSFTHFGSWENAVRAAGFLYEEIKNAPYGERVLLEILQSLFENDKIVCGKKFEWLKYIHKMHIDFYIPRFKLAIERQGEQHYGPVDFGGKGERESARDFEVRKKRDQKKKNLLKRHGIKLLEVKFDDPHTKDFILKGLRKRGINLENQ